MWLNASLIGSGRCHRNLGRILNISFRRAQDSNPHHRYGCIVIFFYVEWLLARIRCGYRALRATQRKKKIFTVQPYLWCGFESWVSLKNGHNTPIYQCNVRMDMRVNMCLDLCTDMCLSVPRQVLIGVALGGVGGVAYYLRRR